MKTVEIKTDGSVSSFVQSALACMPFKDEIELGIYEDGDLVGGCVFDWHEGEPCMMNVAGEGFATVSALEEIFVYAFDVMNLSIVVGMVDPANAAGQAFASGLGATNQGSPAEYAGEGELWTMTKPQCNYYGGSS